MKIKKNRWASSHQIDKVGEAPSYQIMRDNQTPALSSAQCLCIISVNFRYERNTTYRLMIKAQIFSEVCIISFSFIVFLVSHFESSQCFTLYHVLVICITDP